MQQKCVDREEALVMVTAHEAAHLYLKDTRTRGGGEPCGSERCTDVLAFRILNSFRTARAALMLEWSEPPALATRPPKPTPAERKRAKAVADLTKCQRKLKLAQTKVRKLKTRVSYYERKAGNDGAERRIAEVES